MPLSQRRPSSQTNRLSRNYPSKQRISSNQNIPREKGIDHTLDLLLEGYPFIQNRIKKYRSPIDISRVFGK
ncbi:hypothetical protein [Anaerosporobacter sp.]